MRSPWRLTKAPWERGSGLMQVQVTVATADTDGGGRATGVGSPQDMVVKSPVVAAGRSGLGVGDGGALSVGRMARRVQVAS